MGVLVLALLSGCGGAPTDSLLWTEHWEMLVLTRDGGLIDANLSVRNTGLLRAQGQLQASLFSEHEAAIQYRRDVAPVEVAVDTDRTRMRLSLDGLQRGEDPAWPDTWTFRARDMEASVLLHLRPEEGGLAPVRATPESPAWQVEALVPTGQVQGWFSAGQRGGRVEGSGVLLHRSGAGRPPGERTTAVVLAPGISLGVESQGEATLSWLNVDGRLPALGPPTLRRPRPGRLVLEFPGGPEVDIRLLQGIGGRTLLAEHLTLPEQRLLALAGRFEERRVRRGSARLRWPDGELAAPAVVITEAPVEWTSGPERPGSDVNPE